MVRRHKTDYEVLVRPSVCIAAKAATHVRFGSKADITPSIGYVRFTPESGHRARRRACPLCAISGQRRPAQQPTLRTHSGDLQGDLDIPRPSGNDLSMDQINPLPALTQDDVRVRAWAEVREPLELQLAPLGRHALAALAPRPG